MDFLLGSECEPLQATLSPALITRYSTLREPWESSGRPNALAHVIFLTKYSRLTARGRKERWLDVCQRVTECTFSILRTHCAMLGRPWDHEVHQRLAEEFFVRMFHLKFSPAGRGLWAMGTPLLDGHGGGAALNNCAFVSTARLCEAACWLMDAAMLGVGVGFDVAGAGAHLGSAHPGQEERWSVADSRRGWIASLERLLAVYFQGARDVVFDYSEIRSAGSPLRTFGGVASGAEPLRVLHQRVRSLFAERAHDVVTISDVVDLMNSIGVCVSAGNIWRSAQMALGPSSPAFLDLKDPRIHRERNDPDSGWGWASNNTVIVDDEPFEYSEIVERIATNGEPGLFWPRTAKHFGRIADGPARRLDLVEGLNPCGEQPLESGEMCVLVETFPTRHRHLCDYLTTLQLAMLYGKAVTLLSTGWDRTNAIVQRNRRIGCSVTGIAEFVDQRGWPQLERWLDAGYAHIKAYDHSVSSWLGVPASVKLTTVKPSGTLSLLAGVSPGVHWPIARYAVRRLWLPSGSIVRALVESGYMPSSYVYDVARQSCVAEFPVSPMSCRAQSGVPLAERFDAALRCQRLWADNGVSVTIMFQPRTECQTMNRCIASCAGRLKSLAALPIETQQYPVLPYQAATQRDHLDRLESLKPIDWQKLYDVGDDVVQEPDCGARCLVPGTHDAR